MPSETPDQDEFPEFPHQNNETYHNAKVETSDSDPEDFRDTLAFNLLIFAGSVIALVFFGDTLREYGIGPRGSDMSCMSAYTLAIIFAVIFGFISLTKIAEWYRNN